MKNTLFWLGLVLSFSTTESFGQSNDNSIQVKELKEYHENGKVKCILYVDAKKQKQGKQRWYYENGQIKSIEYFKNDVPCDQFIGFHENGRLFFTGYFSNGKIDVKYYRKSGVIECSGQFVADGFIKHGKWSYYDYEGYLTTVEFYKEGEMYSKQEVEDDYLLGSSQSPLPPRVVSRSSFSDLKNLGVLTDQELQFCAINQIVDNVDQITDGLKMRITADEDGVLYLHVQTESHSDYYDAKETRIVLKYLENVSVNADDIEFELFLSGFNIRFGDGDSTWTDWKSIEGTFTIEVKNDIMRKHLNECFNYLKAHPILISLTNE